MPSALNVGPMTTEPRSDPGRLVVFPSSSEDQPVIIYVSRSSLLILCLGIKKRTETIVLSDMCIDSELIHGGRREPL